MDKRKSRFATVRKAVREDDWLLGVALSGLALLITGILPMLIDAGETFRKVVDGVRWGAMGLSLTAVIAIFAKFVALREQVKEVQSDVDMGVQRLEQKLQSLEIHLERERLVELPSTAQYLAKLLDLITSARKRVLLMYFVENPPNDSATEEYWSASVDLVIAKSAEGLHFRRIATIASPAKLRAVLANHQRLFEVCRARGVPCSKVNYRLAYYPTPEIKPPQADIVDDTVLLFSPYSGSTAITLDRVWTRNPTLVENFALYYDGLWRFLESRHQVILNFADRDEPFYKDVEVVNIMKIAQHLGMDEEEQRRLFEKYVQPFSRLTLGRLRDSLGPKSA